MPCMRTNYPEEEIMEDIYRALCGVSTQEMIYAQGTLGINYSNFRPRMDYGYGMSYIKYARILGSETQHRELDLSKLPGMDNLFYRCKCHQDCLEQHTCEQKCADRCTCIGISLPAINPNTFRKFYICEGNCQMEHKKILILNHEMYEKYRSIPQKFRYKHDHMNQDATINLKSYFAFRFGYSMYYFDHSDKILTISTDDKGIPFTKKSFKQYIKHISSDIEKVVFCPIFSSIIYDRAIEIGKIVRKLHVTCPIIVQANM